MNLSYPQIIYIVQNSLLAQLLASWLDWLRPPPLASCATSITRLRRATIRASLDYPCLYIPPQSTL